MEFCTRLANQLMLMQIKKYPISSNHNYKREEKKRAVPIKLAQNSYINTSNTQQPQTLESSRSTMGFYKKKKMTLSAMGFCTRLANQLMLKRIKNDPSKNIVASPLSVNAVLNMVVAGSTGDTLTQMLGFLGSKTIDEINSESAKLMAVAADGCCGSSENAGNGPILTMVNGAWADKRFPLVPKYKEEVLEGIFKCEANNVDFLTKDEQAVGEINSWAYKASKGLIKEILHCVYPGTALVLANGLYFKGLWDSEYKFDATRTQERKFYLLNGSSVLVPFMTSRNEYFYGSFDGFKVLKIPYGQSGKSNRFAMYFFLPDELDGLQNLLQKFDSDSGFLNGEKFELREEMLDEFWIPKFKFSFDFDVSWAMHDMGGSLYLIFNPGDLSPMMNNTEQVRRHLSTQIRQKAYIGVDEKGTEAVAITYMGLVEGCSMSPPKLKRYSFVADHPFLFMIMEEKSGFVFFSGVVLNPTKTTGM